MIQMISSSPPAYGTRMMAHIYVDGKEVLRNAISDKTAAVIKDEASKLAKPGSLSVTLAENDANNFIKFLNKMFNVSLKATPSVKTISNLTGIENPRNGMVDSISYSDRTPGLADGLRVLCRF